MGHAVEFRWRSLPRESTGTEPVNLKVCVCVVIPFILDVRLVDASAGVTLEEGRTRLLHLPSAVLASTFIARRIHSSLSLIDREIEFCVSYPRMNRSPLKGQEFLYLFNFCGEKSQSNSRFCTIANGLRGYHYTTRATRVRLPVLFLWVMVGNLQNVRQQQGRYGISPALDIMRI